MFHAVVTNFPSFEAWQEPGMEPRRAHHDAFVYVRDNWLTGSKVYERFLSEGFQAAYNTDEFQVAVTHFIISRLYLPVVELQLNQHRRGLADYIKGKLSAS